MIILQSDTKDWNIFLQRDFSGYFQLTKKSICQKLIRRKSIRRKINSPKNQFAEN